MSRREAIVVAVLAAMIAADARAEEPAPVPIPIPSAIPIPIPIPNAIPTPIPTPEPPAYLDEAPDVGLWPSHRAEWLVGTDAVSLLLPAVGPALGLGTEAVRAFDAEQRHRAGVHLGVLFAADPKSQALAVHLWPGLRYRFSFHMDDLFDWYLLGRIDFPVGSDPWRAGVLAPGAGVGVRLARTASIEAAAVLPIGLFGDVELDGTSSAVWGALGVAITVDLCRVAADCEPEPPRQVARDCTARLYEQAHDVCESASPVQHAQLCEAVMRALDGGDYAPRQGEDSTRAFLRGLLQELGSGLERAPLHSDVEALQATHDVWRRGMDRQRAATRAAAREERTLRYFTAYAPSAVELRRVLGCYPGDGQERCPTPVEAPLDEEQARRARARAVDWPCGP